MNNISKNYKYILCFIFCTFYQLIFYKYGLNLWDEGALANGALRFLDGEIPLKDFGMDGYPPGRYFLGAIFFKIFGTNLVSLRLPFVLLTSIIVVLLYIACKRIMDKNFAVIASLLLFSAPSMYYNRLFAICTVINIYFITRYVSSGKKSDLAWSLFVILLTFLFKNEIGGISLLVLMLVLVLSAYQDHSKISFDFGKLHIDYKIFIFMISAFAAVIIISALLLGLPVKIYKFIFEMSSLWGNPFPSLFPSSGESLPSYQDFFDTSLYYLPLLIYAATTGLIVKRIFFSAPGIALNKCDTQIVVVLLFGIGTYGLIVWRVGFDNLLRVLPAFYILLCYLLNLLYKKILGPRDEGSNAPSRGSVKNFILSIPVLLFPALFIVNFNFHHGFYAGSIGELRNNHVYIGLDRAGIYAHPFEAIWVEDVVSYIKQETTEDDPIFALPINPIWYFLSGRKNPTSYEWILPQTIKILGKEPQIVDQLKKNIPKVIVYADIAIDGKEERRLSNYAPEVFNFIVANYKLEKISGPFQLLKRKD